MAAIHWSSPASYANDDTDVVTSFRMDIAVTAIDVTSFADEKPKFIPGPVRGLLELDIYNPTVDWTEPFMSGEHVVYVLPDQSHMTVVGIVTGVSQLLQYNQRVGTTVVKMQILEVVG